MLLQNVAFAQQDSSIVSMQSAVWSPDLSDGTYKNPIINADYSDPDVIRVGEDFYMTASSFNCAPGLPVLHSKDLVNWEIIGNALLKLVPEDVFAVPQHSKGVWAPSLRYHDGQFYIYWGDPDFGVYVITSKEVTGPWTSPDLILHGKGIIDPCPLWDGEKAYLVHAWAGSRAGVNSLLTLYEMNLEGTKVLGNGVNIFDGHGANHTIEGPKLYKKDGYYYIFAPAGGVEAGWQLALRAKNIFGPYDYKVVLEQGSTNINGPHQGAWVENQNGTHWFIHFQDKGVYGRVLHLQPMEWRNHWPLIGRDTNGNGIGEPVTVFMKPVVKENIALVNPQESDDFLNGKPGLQWQWYANPSVKWSAQIPGTDYLRLFAVSKGSLPNLWDMPNLLLQKLPAPDFTVTTKMALQTEWETPGKTAGLLMMGQSYAYVGLTFKKGRYWVRQVVCNNAIKGKREKVTEEKPIYSNQIYLRMQVSSPQGTCSFSYSTDGKNYSFIGDGFNAQKDLWISAKMGLFCTSEPNVRLGGYADFDWFRVTE